MNPELAALVDSIGPPDDAAYAAALARQAVLTKPTGSLGRLEELSAWLCSVRGTCPPPGIRAPALAIFAGDHGVARAAGTSAYSPDVTAQMVCNFVAGGAAANVLARSRGAAVRVVDVSVDADWAEQGVRLPAEVTRYRVMRGSGSIDREDAMSQAQAIAAIEVGVTVCDELVDDGHDLLVAGDMGIGNTTSAAVLVGLLAGLDAARVTGRGTGVDDEGWMRKVSAVRDAMRRARRLTEDPVALLAAVAGADLAAVVGFLLRAAARRTPVLLDGVVPCACALVGQVASPAAPAWWRATHRSTEPAAEAALTALGQEPLLDLGMRLGEGTGALLALPIVSAAGDLLREMATFSEAGVSDRTGSQP